MKLYKAYFVLLKGIQKKKRERMVWDEVAKVLLSLLSYTSLKNTYRAFVVTST